MGKFRNSIAFKSIFGIVILLIVFSAVVSLIGYRGFSDALIAQYADGAFRVAEAAAQSVDADRMYKYEESEGRTWEYQTVWMALDQACNASGATFIYVIEPDLTDYAHITFLFSTMNRGRDYTQYDFGYYRETSNDEYREKYRALYEGRSDRELVIRDQGYIETDYHITAMIPLKDSAGEVKAILCVQFQMEALAVARQTYIQKVILVVAIAALAMIITQGVYLSRVLIRPVTKITEEADRFAGENAAARIRLSDTIRNRDEIGQLAASIDHMEDQIQTYVSDLTRITAETERVSTELSLATRIQLAMLPNRFPAFPDRSDFDIYAVMDPAREVGGDFYDFFLIDDDHLGMVVADVSGKGVPAALFMMATKIVIANHAKAGLSPGQVLEKTNASVCANNREEMFVTVWLGILELSTGKLISANAGHEYPALMRPGGRYELLKAKHGFVIGGMEGMTYREFETYLEPGSKLFMYTDGVPEAADADGNMFGTERMLEALDASAGEAPGAVLAAIRDAVDGFVKDAEQFDDLTMLCLEYKGICGKEDRPSAGETADRDPTV